MAKVYLDANFFVDLVEKRRQINRKQLIIHNLYISPLSIHILTYLYKYHLPDERLAKIDKFFKMIPINSKLTIKALSGPTFDFEDNVQLHSAAEVDCDIFLTSDKKLLNMRFFGKTKIQPDLTNESVLG